MELFYNPDAMSEDELRRTFVGESRRTMLADILESIPRQPDGAGVQHVVIQGPRGMGKTTLLLMLRMQVLESDFAARWQPVKFPEELYGVSDLVDLWIETLRLLAHDTQDDAPARAAESVRETFTQYKALHDGAFAALRDWRRVTGKRLLLLVDNLDLLLNQIGDEQENARLRNLLMNDGTVMIVGGATSFFEEARAHDQPLYNFFRFFQLNGLRHDEVLDLLRRRAEIDNIQDFESILQRNMARFRALEYFTAGSPRLVLMLYRVVTLSDFGESRKGLEKLLDEVTPYYKAKTEARPPQQRKILDHIARESARTREGVTPTAIASATRLPVNQVSAQLKRLTEDGYVRPANLRTRSSFYALSEPLYAIWYQMRFGRNARERMAWLVEFMRVWYEGEDLAEELNRLEINPQYSRSCLELGILHYESGRHREACECFSHVIDSQENAPVGYGMRFLSRMWVALAHLTDGKLDLAKSQVAQAISDIEHYPHEEWLAFAEDMFTMYAGKGGYEFVRDLIRDNGLEEPLFPLVRALEYLASGDEALIEKLSPEVRGVVKEVVERLQRQAEKSKPPSEKKRRGVEKSAEKKPLKHGSRKSGRRPESGGGRGK